MAEDFFSDAQTRQASSCKHVFRLHRRLFLLVFAVAVLWQSLLLIDMRLGQYYRELNDSFKVILTLPDNTAPEKLSHLQEFLKNQAEVATVKFVSPSEALNEVRRQNPQLVESLLFMGQNQMPAYFELRLEPSATGHLEELAVGWSTYQAGLTPHYNADHARLLFVTGLTVKLLRVSMSLAGLLFLVFMFLVEAYPTGRGASHLTSALWSGLLAGVCAGLFLAGLIYPTGFLNDVIHTFTTLQRQILLLVFCGLFGWTLSKWQKF
ncbi:MAG: permease-like cell division protein FtsX [Elusimicrobiaceae bacterium]|nr:permease-like cell division protein FtsX [Elusimicrobiaceae bacterium]